MIGGTDGDLMAQVALMGTWGAYGVLIGGTDGDLVALGGTDGDLGVPMGS